MNQSGTRDNILVKLSELRIGERGHIRQVSGDEAFRKRIAELGFVPGVEVESVRKAPFRDPGAYLVRGTHISLRNAEASRIEVSLAGEFKVRGKPSDHLLLKGSPSPKRISPAKERELMVALVGNPNCGKTSLFNYASRSREKVANYSGVTVSMKEATLYRDGYRFTLIDLPGTYSLSAHSPEEEYVREFLMKQGPDIVVNVLDSTRLERNLYLTTQLIDMKIPVVIALNMFDELQGQRDYLKYDQLGRMLGIPFVPTIARKGKGIEELLKKIIRVFEGEEDVVRQVDIPYNAEIEQGIQVLQDKLYQITDDPERHIGQFGRYLAVRLLEGDIKVLDHFRDMDDRKLGLLEEARARIEHIDSLYHAKTSDLITDDKYGFIEGALKETLILGGEKKQDISRRIDNVLTHSKLSLPIFFGIILLVFYITFSIGTYPVSWLENLFELLNDGLAGMLPESVLRDMVTRGIVPGVGAVAVFLPNIIILFLFISFLEDTGYMARTAFIVDRIMHRAGLHGKSFIPILIGFGCNVPAIMATRTVEDGRNRLLTMLIIPFMSCSARLPVYVLFISAFFPSWKPLVLFSLYMIGIILAWITLVIFCRLLFKRTENPFVMELPPYRLPTPKAIVQHMWFKTYYFIKKMGGVILLASVIIWALGYFPAGNRGRDTAMMEQQDIIQERETDAGTGTSRIENSWIGMIGKWIHPVFEPLGFDWKMSVSILTGLPAKEIIVSTLGVLYQTDPGFFPGRDSISGKKVLASNERSMLRAFSFMVFTLLYFPCIGTLVVLRRESGSIRWTLITLGYTTLVAWITSFLIFQGGSILA